MRAVGGDGSAVGGELAAVVLWDVPAAEHDRWRATGCGDCSRGEYARRLRAAVGGARSAGQRVVLASPTVDQVLREVSRQGRPNTAEGRAAAVAALWMSRECAGEEVVE